MKLLTQKEIVHLITNLSGAKPIGIEAETDAKARKTGNPFGVILKRSRSVGFVGARYGSAVERQQLREGEAPDFDAAPLPWGNWLVPNKLIEHKGKLYLRTQTAPGQRERQSAKVLSYRGESGQFLSKEDVKPFLPEKQFSVKQEAAGLVKEKQIEVRNFALDNILKLRIGGRTYGVKKD